VGPLPRTSSPAAASHGGAWHTVARVSVATEGAQANKSSYSAAVSADGRVVAFQSDATNLVPGDTNGVVDVFVRDRQAGTTERVNVAADGAQANGGYGFTNSGIPALSADGRFVAFTSDASNLVPGDTNGVPDIFVRDRQAGTTERVSVAAGGAQANGFGSDTPSLSVDGRFVAFRSFASNLVPGDTSSVSDIFVRDRQAGTTERINVASDGTEAGNTSDAPSLSVDGRFVAFRSGASNLVPGDTNGVPDIFVRDRQAGTTERVNVAADGAQANDGYSFPGGISADGRFVAFTSDASNLVPGDTGPSDIFVRDRQAGTTERVNVAADGTQANGFGAYSPFLSADGRFVAFQSTATNLVPGDTNDIGDVFVAERAEGGPTPTATPTDTAPPSTTVSVSPGANASGWHTSDVAVSLTAADDAGGSGVKELSYALSGAQSGGAVVTGSNASFTVAAEGLTTVTYFARDRAGNAESAKHLDVRIEKVGPTITISAPLDGAVLTTDQSLFVAFGATDTGSGLALLSAAFNGVPVTSGQSVSLAMLAGQRTLTVLAEDVAGNRSTKTATATVKIKATIDCDPDTLNTGAGGPWVTCYVEFPAGYDVRTIDGASVTLNGAAAAYLGKEGWAKPGATADNTVDHDGDGRLERLVKFDRQQVAALLPLGDAVPVTLTGRAGALEFVGGDALRITAGAGPNATSTSAALRAATGADVTSPTPTGSAAVATTSAGTSTATATPVAPTATASATPASTATPTTAAAATAAPVRTPTPAPAATPAP
jgi:Tol biopolymer transport system component